MSNLASPCQLSFEFFPPKTEAMEEMLWKSVEVLSPLAPTFVSVTYGAGGSTRERTHSIVKKIVDETALKPAAHLTCVDASCDEVDEVVRDYIKAGVNHIVALRGDPAQGVGSQYVPHPQGYKNAADLVAGIQRLGDFEISVSAYPEKHPESASFYVDMAMLKAKWQAGAKRAITQFFFDPEFFMRYMDLMAQHNIEIDLLPGIIPVHNFKQVSGFAQRCGTTIPQKFRERFEAVDGNELGAHALCVDYACESMHALHAMGVRHFHFYTLNRGALIKEICDQSGLFA